MDVHYIKPTEAVLTEAMDNYTKWLDGELKTAIGDQNGDQEKKTEKSSDVTN
jgi:hypothetical protein